MDSIIIGCRFVKQLKTIIMLHKIIVKYNRLSKYDFKAVQQGYGNWLITYTYPKGRKISAVLTAISYDVLQQEEPTQRKLKHIKDVIKYKNLTQVN